MADIPGKSDGERRCTEYGGGQPLTNLCTAQLPLPRRASILGRVQAFSALAVACIPAASPCLFPCCRAVLRVHTVWAQPFSHSLPHGAFLRLFISDLTALSSFLFLRSSSLPIRFVVPHSSSGLSSPSQVAPLTKKGMAFGANLIELSFSLPFMPQFGIASAQALQPGQTFGRPSQRFHPHAPAGPHLPQSHQSQSSNRAGDGWAVRRGPR